MTYHIRTPEYECKKCGRIFIAYHPGLECPNCETPEESKGEAFNFIQDLARSMLIHKREFGTFKPPVWSKTTFTDYVQGIVYKSFDFAEANPDKGLEYMLEVFRVADPGNKDAENKQIRRILLQVSFEYQKISQKKEGWLEKKLRNLKEYLP